VLGEFAAEQGLAMDLAPVTRDDTDTDECSGAAVG
jgi:hypothetical protein